MIEQIYNDVAKKAIPPEYVFDIKVTDDIITINRHNSNINIDAIDCSDPLVEYIAKHILTYRALRTVDDKWSYVITHYNSNYERDVWDMIDLYMRDFLNAHLNAKRPYNTKLYQWSISNISSYNYINLSTKAKRQIIALYRYLHKETNHLYSGERNKHVNNGIAVLEKIRSEN